MARSCGDVRAVTAGTAARHASRSRTAPGPILAVRIDLEQYTETYDVHDARATSLAAVLRLGKQAAAEGDGERRLAGAVLRSAREEVIGLLDEQQP